MSLTYKEALKIYNDKVHKPYRYATPLKNSEEMKLVKLIMKGKSLSLNNITPQQIYNKPTGKKVSLSDITREKKVKNVLQKGEKLGFESKKVKEVNEDELQKLFSKAREMGFNF